MENHFISLNPEVPITFAQLRKVLDTSIQLRLSDTARSRIEEGYRILQEQLKKEEVIYGVNTGFGALANERVSDLQTLQENLIRSHSSGVGSPVPIPIVRLMLFLKIAMFCKGYSGVSLELVERLIEWFNKGLYPVVPCMGSLGASGDLAPLAHLALPLLGEGALWYQNRRISGTKALEILQKKPYKLQPKEGLALINGTQFMQAYLAYVLLQLEKIWKAYLYTAAYSLDVFLCRLEPYMPEVQALQAYEGQQYIAEQIRDLLKDSQLQQLPRPAVQDPYSFRCIPQIYGAVWDTYQRVKEQLLIAVNGVSDNPVVLWERRRLAPTAHFHGQPLALAADQLRIALVALGAMAERRIYLLLSGKRNLPKFLTANPGIESGYMLLQYTAAALVNQLQSLAMPVTPFSIPTSDGQEDFVSMGANAVLKLYEQLPLLQRIQAIEWMCARRAHHFRGNYHSGSAIEVAIAQQDLQFKIPEQDHPSDTLIEQIVQFWQYN